MRNRRNTNLPFYVRVVSAGAALALRLCAKATHRPVDFAAILIAVATSLTIVVNAVFLQSGSHPAPFFATPKPLPITVSGTLKPADKFAEPTASMRPAVTTIAPQTVAARRNDPIADLIGPSPRIAAVQHALSDYGYGQLKSSGVLDDATSTAIEKFEREHKLPVTGRVSERLVTELTAMVGHPLD